MPSGAERVAVAEPAGDDDDVGVVAAAAGRSTSSSTSTTAARRRRGRGRGRRRGRGWCPGRRARARGGRRHESAPRRTRSASVGRRRSARRRPAIVEHRVGASPTPSTVGVGPTQLRATAATASCARTSITRRPADSENSAAVLSGWSSASRTVAPRPEGDAELGEGHGQAALTHVVARQDEAVVDRTVERPGSAPAPSGRAAGRLGSSAATLAVGAGEQVEVAAGEVLPSRPSSRVRSPAPAARRSRTLDVGHVGDGRDHQGRRHGVAPRRRRRRCCSASPCPTRTAHRGRSPPAAAGDGGDELAEGRRVERVAPREVVEQGDAVGVGADGDDVRIASSTTTPAIASGSCSPYQGLTPMPTASRGVVGGGEHDAVAVAAVALAEQRTHHGGAADLMVVAVDDRRLRGDVPMGEQVEQRRRRSSTCRPPGRRGGAGASAPSRRCGGRRGGTRCRGRPRGPPPSRTTSRPCR